MTEKTSKKRVIAFIDGFNLYHAIHDLNKDDKTQRFTNSKHYLKWLDIWKLANALTHPVNEELVAVHYFSAYADWISEDAKNRHKAYTAALRASKVNVVMGSFKAKPKKCPNCKHEWVGHEEKESDVNIAITLLQSAYKDEFDIAIIFTADTDLAPAIKMVKDSFHNKIVKVAIPERRMGKRHALVDAAHGKFKIVESQLMRSLFPEKIITVNGKEITRPEKYRPPF